jgi:hypothetical protein
MLEETLGAKFNTVVGYPGGSEVDMAVEKGEVMCRAQNISAHFGREPFESWHKKDFDRHIVQSSRKRDPRVGDVPTIYELFDQYKTPPNSRRLAQALVAGGDFGRPMLVTPGTPPERIKILRAAYVKTLNDAEVIAEAKKSKMDVEPTSGEDLEALVKDILDSPPEVLERVKQLLANESLRSRPPTTFHRHCATEVQLVLRQEPNRKPANNRQEGIVDRSRRRSYVHVTRTRGNAAPEVDRRGVPASGGGHS